MGLSKAFSSFKNSISESLGFHGVDKVFNTVGSWVNNISGQTDAFNKSQQANWDMWNANNAYNTPENMMNLYKQAGLNPNLMAGASTSHAYASGSAPNMSAGGASVLSMLATIFGIKADLALKGAQTKLTDAQAGHIDAQTRLLNQEAGEYNNTGTSRATPYPVKLTKSAFNELKAAGEGLGALANEKMPTNGWYDILDDVFSGSFTDNMNYYRSLNPRQKKIYKQKLKDLRGYTDVDFEGW